MSGRARAICLRALERGIIPEQRREEVLCLVEGAASDEAAAEALVEQGILTQEQLDELLAAAATRPGDGQLSWTDVASAHTVPGTAGAEQASGMPSDGFPRPFGEDYELLGLLGAGGMGEVYKAWDSRLRRHVAIKVITSCRVVGQDFLGRFRIEAQAAARLRHPHIVAVHQVGVHEGQDFFTMDLVDGTSLSKLIWGAKLDLAQSVELLEKVARAVHYAHEHGIIHRDLKPGNILVDARGEPLVTDFGLAKDLETEYSLSMSTAVLGTPSYMSPEQAEGRSSEADARSDVYSLGAILYEMLSGRPPFRAASMAELLRMSVRDDPVPPRRLSTVVPPDAETICLKCLAKEPERRYQSAGELADDLRRFLDGQPILARPSSLWYRTRKRLLRNKAATAFAALAIVVAAALLTGWIVTLQARTRTAERAQGDAEHARDEAEQARRTTEGALAEAEHQRRAAQDARLRAEIAKHRAQQQQRLEEQRKLTAQRLLYAVGMKVVQDAWDKRDLPSVIRLLGGLRPMPGQNDVRGWEWFHLWQLCHGNRLTLRAHTAGVYSVAFSPDGRTLASAGADKTAKLWDAATGQKLATLTGHAGSVTTVAFSPDGTTLATGSRDCTVKLWDVATRKELATLRGHGQDIIELAFSPDGATLATGGGTARAPGELKLWDIALREELATLEGYRGPVHAVAFSPDGKVLATGSGAVWTGGETRLWDVATRKELARLEGARRAVWAVAFSPDARSLATGSVDHTVTVWDVAKREELATLKGHAQFVHAVAFSPDGRRLATAGGIDNRMGELKLWDVASAAEMASFQGHTDAVRAVAFSPNGKTIATGSLDGTVRLWDLARTTDPAEQGVVLRGRPCDVQSVAFSPDGRLLATASSDHSAKLWDPATGRQLAVLRGHRWPVSCVAFSPDGKWLATASWDRTVKLWDVATRRASRELAHPAQVFAAAFSPDGKTLATAGGGIGLTLWDLSDGRKRLSVPSQGTASAIAFSPDGKRLAVAIMLPDRTGRLKLWDVAQGKELATLKGHNDWVWSLAFSPDGTAIASASEDRTAKLWDAATGRELATIEQQKSDAVRSLAFSPDGTTLALGSMYGGRNWPVGGSGVVNLYRLAATPGGAERQTITAKLDTHLATQTSPIRSLAFSPNGRTLATASTDGTVKLWDTPTWKPRLSLPGHANGITSAAFSPDGRTLATGHTDFAVRLFDPATEHERATLTGHTDIVRCVAFSPDGTMLASAGYDRTVVLWNAAEAKKLATLTGHKYPVTSVAFSPDGKTLASADALIDKKGCEVKLWDVATRQSRATLASDCEMIRSIAFSPDGSTLAAAIGVAWYNVPGQVRLWDTATGRERAALAGHKGPVLCAAFSPDGKTLATGSWDQTVKLWDVAAAAERATLDGHRSGVLCLAFSPDGRTLVSGGVDRTIKVWDLAVPQERAAFRGHSAAVTSLAFSPDGTTLATGTEDGALRLRRGSRTAATPPAPAEPSR